MDRHTAVGFPQLRPSEWSYIIIWPEVNGAGGYYKQPEASDIWYCPIWRDWISRRMEFYKVTVTKIYWYNKRNFNAQDNTKVYRLKVPLVYFHPPLLYILKLWRSVHRYFCFIASGFYFYGRVRLKSVFFLKKRVSQRSTFALQPLQCPRFINQQWWHLPPDLNMILIQPNLLHLG